jgi:hypothetical protein
VPGASVKKDKKRKQNEANGEVAFVHWLDAFDVERSARGPRDYVALLLEGVVKNVCLLRADGSKDRCTADEVQRVAHDLFDPIERLEREDHKLPGSDALDPERYARIAYAYCRDAELAFDNHDVIKAWTLIVDAMRVAANLTVPIAHRAGGVFLTSSHGVKAGKARHAKSGHASSETKEAVRQLWSEWMGGNHPEWAGQEQFAEGCKRYLNGANASTDTIVKKWIPEWTRNGVAKK